MSTGHVFVIQGALALLDYDAVIVSTDWAFSVSEHWSSVLGTPLRADRSKHADAAPLKPDEWFERRYGRAREPQPGAMPPRPTWFLDVARYQGESAREGIDSLMVRLDATLRDIDNAVLMPRNKRVRPLVAMPTIGVRGGGWGDLRGQIVERQLEISEAVVESSGIDVVIVATHPSDYAAFQAMRRGRPTSERHIGPERVEQAEQLGRLARSGRLALFVGAGVSMSAGLPSWRELIHRLAQEAADVLPEANEANLEGWSELDKAELLQSALGPRFGDAVRRSTAADRYGIGHGILAALGCREVVTTNFDPLYEMAADAVGGRKTVSVLPFDPIPARDPWVLKMHGDANYPDSIILSRSDFVGYDAGARPMGSILQSLMITRHLLVVGTSMTDDNFLRLALEVVRFSAEKGRVALGDEGVDGRVGSERKPARATGELGTVVTLAEEPARARLWRGRFRYVAASQRREINEQARDLSIFLDAVAMYAAPRSYLLDERYGNLLGGEEERSAAKAVREAAALIGQLPVCAREGAWSELYEALMGHGAGRDVDPLTSSGTAKS